MSLVRGDQKVSRNAASRSLSLGKTATSVSASTLTFDAFSTTTQIFIGSTVGQIVSLGDATGYVQSGLCFILINDATVPVTVKNLSGTTLFTLQPNYSLLVFLDDQSTTDGTWRFSLFVDKTLDSLSESSRGGIFCGFDGTGSTGRWLEFFSNNPSNNNPLVIPEASSLRAISISTSAATATGTVTVFKNGVAVETISLAASKTARKKNLNVLFTDLDLISLKVTSGSITRPQVTIFIRTL